MLASRTSERPTIADAVSGGIEPVAAGASACRLPIDTSRQARAVPSGPDSAEKHGRLLSLDMLRGVAILLVLGRHTVAPVAGLGPLTPLAAAWTHIGWSGVDLFFVLSGFLVSGLIFAEFKRAGAVDIRRFVIRRGFKIWPPYLVYVGFVACWLAWKQYHGGSTDSVWQQLWPNLFHVQNYFHTPRVHTWSLAVEEHFYLAVAIGFWWWLSLRSRAAPAFSSDGDSSTGGAVSCGEGNDGAANRGAKVLLRGREPLQGFPWLVASLVALLAGIRTIAYLHAGPDVNLYATHLRFDGLLIGTLLAYLTHFRSDLLAPLLRHPLALIAIGVLAALPVLCVPPETNVWTAGIGLTGMYVGYGLFLLGWLNLPLASAWGRWLFRTRAAVWLGAIGFYSYSIYLWHIDLAQTPLHKVALWAAGHGAAAGLVYAVTTAIYVGVAVLTGRLLAGLLERPSIALRDRLFPSTVRAVAPAARAK